MPNWCYNRVEIYSEKEGIRRFKAFVRDDDERPFSLEKIMPMPQKVAASLEPNPDYPPELHVPSGDDWYEWRNKMWGVKWDTRPPRGENGMYEGLPEVDGDYDYEVIYNFDTPWGPPVGIYKYLVQGGLIALTGDPDATISWFWHEWGMQSAGYLKA